MKNFQYNLTKVYSVFDSPINEDSAFHILLTWTWKYLVEKLALHPGTTKSLLVEAWVFNGTPCISTTGSSKNFRFGHFTEEFHERWWPGLQVAVYFKSFLTDISCPDNWSMTDAWRTHRWHFCIQKHHVEIGIFCDNPRFYPT